MVASPIWRVGASNVDANTITEELAAAIAHLVRIFTQPATEPVEDKTERRARTEPTVAEVRRGKYDHLRGVASGGDASDDDLQAQSTSSRVLPGWSGPARTRDRRGGPVGGGARGPRSW